MEPTRHESWENSGTAVQYWGHATSSQRTSLPIRRPANGTTKARSGSRYVDTPPGWAAALMAESRSSVSGALWAHRTTRSDRTVTTPSSSHYVPSEAAGSRLVRSQKVDTRTPDGGKPI